MLNVQLQAELETEIRGLFPESGMEQYTALVMGAVNNVLLKASLLSVANDKKVTSLLTAALSLQLQQENKSKITWTGSKVELVELIYALHTKGVFNNGKAKLRDIEYLFETCCGVALGNTRRQFIEIRERKSAPTLFLDGLKEKLVKRMLDADG